MGCSMGPAYWVIKKRWGQGEIGSIKIKKVTRYNFKARKMFWSSIK
jgi:hypothetical protein